MICLKFYFPNIVNFVKMFLLFNTVPLFQNLQDNTIPIMYTRSDQHRKQNLIISPRLLAPSCYLNWDIHSLAKQSLLFLSIVLVLCKFMTPCTTITFKYVLFSIHFIVWLVSVQGSSEIYLISEIFLIWMEWYSRSSLSLWSRITIRFDSI